MNGLYLSFTIRTHRFSKFESACLNTFLLSETWTKGTILTMLEQYIRTSLIVDKEKLAHLWNKRILIFGVGGVGGNALESLARIGIGSFDIVDDDTVALSNINRQILATRSTYGQNKVDVAEQRVHDVNPEIIVNKHQTFYLPDKKEEFDFSKFDYILDCIDTVTAKIDIICEAKRVGVPVISAMGCGNRLDPTKLVLCDIYETKGDPLSKIMRHELKKRNITSLKVVCSTEQPIKPKAIEYESSLVPGKKNVPGSTSFVPPVAGTFIGYQVAMDLINSEDKEDNIRKNNPFLD